MKQLMHSFKGTTAPPEVLDAIKTGDISAICLFGYNVESLQQIRKLVMSMREAARSGGQQPPIIGIDQEGGQLIAITGGTTELPGNMALGAAQSPELAQKAGEILGRELLAIGINMNFAPSLDVNINPQNPVIGIRSFGDDPQLVGELGTALIKGMQAQNVIASAKHFPGHGDTNSDSHHATPRVDHPRERLDEIELKPFAIAIADGVQAVMSSHIIFSEFDDERPGTISPRIMQELLREELGFTGITITDAMDMHAVSSLGHKFAVEQAILAGNDLVLLGHLPGQIDLMKQLKHMESSASLERIEAIRANLTWELPDFSVIGCAEHTAIAQEIADKSITLVRDNDRLPLNLSDDQTIAIITVTSGNLTPADTSGGVEVKFAHSIQQRHHNILEVAISHQATKQDISDAVKAVECADVVIVGTISAEIYREQAQLVNALIELGKSPIVVAMRTPYDLIAFPDVQTYLCTYGIRDASMEAVARVLFGEIIAEGILPCNLPEFA